MLEIGTETSVIWVNGQDLSQVSFHMASLQGLTGQVYGRYLVKVQVRVRVRVG